jgi:hypothetical protein
VPKVVILEPGRRQVGNQRVVLDGFVWQAVCGLGRLHGFAVSDEEVIRQVDAKLFADALRRGAAALDKKEQPLAVTRGSSRFTATADWPQAVFVQPHALDKLRQVLALIDLEVGLVITTREKT